MKGRQFPLDAARKSILEQIEAAWYGPEDDSLRLASVMHGDIPSVHDLIDAWTAQHIHDYLRSRDIIPISSEYKRRLCVALTFRLVREKLVANGRDIECNVGRDWGLVLDEVREILNAIPEPEARLMIYLIACLHMLPQDVALMFDCEPSLVHRATHGARAVARNNLGTARLRELTKQAAERRPKRPVSRSARPDPWAHEPLTLPPSPVWETFETMVMSSPDAPSSMGGDHD